MWTGVPFPSNKFEFQQTRYFLYKLQLRGLDSNTFLKSICAGFLWLSVDSPRTRFFFRKTGWLAELGRPERRSASHIHRYTKLLTCILLSSFSEEFLP